MSEATELKATLLSLGAIHVPSGTRLGVYPDRSVSGPDSSGRWVFFDINGELVKLKIVRDPGCRAHLRGDQAPFDIMLDGKVAATDVNTLKTIYHAPGQAFVSLGNGCRFHCAFCTLHQNKANPAVDRDAIWWVKFILKGARREDCHSVAVTGGVEGELADHVQMMTEVVKDVRAELPDIPIGVEPYLESPDDVERLKRAGATEIKLNLETATPELFETVCPELDRDAIWRCLERSVEVFGRGRVSSNIIFGLGETDEDVLDMATRLARMGVAANLRALRVNAINRTALKSALGKDPYQPDAERMIRLAHVGSRILQVHNISRDGFYTMCHRCRGCDL